MTDIIFGRIEKKIKVKDDCEVYTGTLRKGRIIIRYLYRPYNVREYIWNHYNPDNLIDENSLCVMSCDTELCVKVSHMLKTIINQETEYEKIYKRLLSTSRVVDECIEWTGVLTSAGYGQVTYQSKNIKVHKLSLMIKLNLTELDHSIGNTVIRHTCNNKKCFNPEHLILGTHVENAADRVGAGISNRGEKSSSATITEELAQKIKLSKYPRNHKKYKPQKDRAKKFGVSLNIVSEIDCGRSWSHLKDKDGNDNLDKKDKINEKDRERRKSNKEVEWTDEMREEAKVKLEENSTLQIVDNEHTGTPCIYWTGGISKDGYGMISIHGMSFRTHIVSCEIKYKRHRLEEEITRHLCGNRICINSEHLKFGTRNENSIDAIEHGSKVAKLTKEQVLEIREKYTTGKFTYVKLAEEYKCDQTNIGSIIRKETWI